MSNLWKEKSRDKNKELAERLSKEHFERLSRIRGEDEKQKEKESSKSQESDHKKKKSKESKERLKEPKGKKKEVFDWDEEYMGYTNSDNPFGDANLLKTFVWTKKYEKMGIKDIDPEEIERENRIKQKENKRELEKVKERRLQREREREARLEELAKAQREKEALQFKEWEKQEDTFHLKQAKLRSQLRIREGRAKPIDLLARYIDVVTAKDEKTDNVDIVTPFELLEPYMYLNGLRITDLEDLQEDIKVYMELDDKSNIDYWKDLQTIVTDELQKLRKFQSGSENEVDRREGINTAVSPEVTAIFQGKTLSQLCVLQVQMEEKIRSGKEGVDVSYWETLLCKLKAIIAKARLKEHHEEYQKLERSKIKTEKKENNEKKNTFPIIKTEQDVESESVATTKDSSNDDKLNKCIEDYISGRYSPVLISENQVEIGTVVIDAEEDWRNLQSERIRVMNEMGPPEKQTTKSVPSAAEMAFDREARRGMTSDETEFSSEEVIKQDKSVTSWSDKYRPRKPRYFNRVHTGFEWNKYNQTHYDVDNPPPKIVQGYKFNIFYPDLIDKQRTPSYTVTACPDNRDFAIIRFSAGPPYEDIAFKIVNREWNYSYKSGFRCQFHNNILQLWFHFKRYRYRR